MVKKCGTARAAVPKPKSATEAGAIGDPDETFIDDLRHILLKSYGGKNPALDDRQRLLDILELNTKYLKRSGADASHEAHDKLAVIGLALLDLEAGITHPIFKARKLEHGAPESTDIWRSRTTLAIAFDYLMVAGVLSQDASKKISKAPGIEKLLSKGAKAETSLINWRVRPREGTVANELALEQWDWSRKFIEKLTGPPSDKHKKLKAEADRMFAVAIKLISKIWLPLSVWPPVAQ
jgi:hypothetical protein